MAEALLRKRVAQNNSKVSIKSSGLYAKTGRRADARAVSVAAQFGIRLADHEAQPLTRELVDDADAIFVMDHINEARLLGRFPEAKSKLYLLGSLSESKANGSYEIPDPYTGTDEDILHSYKIINSCVTNLAHALSPRGTENGDNAYGAVRLAEKARSRDGK